MGHPSLWPGLSPVGVSYLYVVFLEKGRSCVSCGTKCSFFCGIQINNLSQESTNLDRLSRGLSTWSEILNCRERFKNKMLKWTHIFPSLGINLQEQRHQQGPGQRLLPRMNAPQQVNQAHHGLRMSPKARSHLLHGRISKRHRHCPRFLCPSNA